MSTSKLVDSLHKLMPAGSPRDGGKAAAAWRSNAEADAARDAKNRSAGGTPPPPVAVPPSIAARVHMPKLDSVIALREQAGKLDGQEADVRGKQVTEHESYRAAKQAAADAMAEALANGAPLQAGDAVVRLARKHADAEAGFEVQLAGIEQTRRTLTTRFETAFAADIRALAASLQSVTCEARAEQAAALETFREAQSREAAAHEQALQELGRTRRAFRDLKLPAPWEVTGGEPVEYELNGVMISGGRSPEMRRSLDTPDRKTIRRFLDGHLGVQQLITLPRMFVIGVERVRDWFAAAAQERP